MRDHLFISYATEDAVFARWLALRLTSYGYRVWIDEFQLLGGERYPAEIDAAIKERTFRVIAILSRHSIAKPNPVKERTLALNLARERREDFLVPLNLDGLKPTELDWMSSDLTFIPFDQEWASGLAQLLELLQRSQAPILADAVGPRAAREAIRTATAVVDMPEQLGSNLLPVLHWPEVIHQYRFTREVSSQDLLDMSECWAFHFLPPKPGRRQLAYAFDDPPGGVFGDARAVRNASAVWKATDEFHEVPTWNLIKPITIRALYLECRAKGLEESSDGSFVYFPEGLLRDNRIRYVSYGGRRVPLKVVGERRFRGNESFRYHLGFRLDLLRLPGGHPYLKVGVRLRLTDLEGLEFETVAALARRKSLTRTWYNHQFYSRTLAIAAFLADENGEIRCGGPDHLIVSGTPLALDAPLSLDETVLPKGRQPFRRRGAFEEEEPE
ncbi:toll/interleukin-1 receptor domain-containing protein [Gemmatimonadota bacterium]